MYKLTFATLALSLSLIHPVFAGDQKPTCSKKCHCPEMQKMQKMLKLTPDQKTKIEAIRMQAKEKLMANHEALLDIKKQIHALTHEKTMNESQLNALAQKKANLVAENTKIRAMTRHQIYEVLTPEQQAKFNKMEANWKKEHQGGHHRHHSA